MGSVGLPEEGAGTYELYGVLGPFLQVSVPVDVMPGEFDPTNYTLPQQPLHPCMFPLATAYSTLQLVTNPYQATIDGVR